MEERRRRHGVSAARRCGLWVETPEGRRMLVEPVARGT